jgi:hypothetical protein
MPRSPARAAGDPGTTRTTTTPFRGDDPDTGGRDAAVFDNLGNDAVHRVNRDRESYAGSAVKKTGAPSQVIPFLDYSLRPKNCSTPGLETLTEPHSQSAIHREVGSVEDQPDSGGDYYH